jgi:hypothetical protein
MALTQDQKLQVFQAAASAIPLMSSAEYLRATIAQASAYAAATDPAVVAPTIIAEIAAFRVTNKSAHDWTSDPPGFGFVDPVPAQLAAKLGYSL